MEAAPEDPLKSYDQNWDFEKDASVDRLATLKKTANQTEDSAYNELCVQNETQSLELGTGNCHSESKASETSACKLQQGAIFSGKVLRFCCSECKGDTTYSPNDLLKHFQGAHVGKLPLYPCDLCTFVTNEFSSLQRHRIGHRDTLVTCQICNDGVQYTLLLLTRHFLLCHSSNGHFRCEKCEFSTRDSGTFVQHIHHHNDNCVKHPSTSPTQGKIQSGKVHAGAFPFTCQLCGYGAARKEYLSTHMTVAHGDEMDRTNRWRSIDDNSRINSPSLKLLLKKSPPAGGSREPKWMSKLNSYPGVGLLDQSGRLLNPERTVEETQKFLERDVGVKKETSKWSKSSLRSEPQSSFLDTSTTPQPKIQDGELGAGSGILDPGSSNGLTVLMVKNKISIPPNCTTKVMGFKMLDGKKHLVLKVIPTKQEATSKNELSSPSIVRRDDVRDKSVSSHCTSLSEGSGSHLRFGCGTKNGVAASVKTETYDIENHSGDQSTLFDENEANVDDEILEISGTSVIKASALSCSKLSKEVEFLKKHCSCSDLEKKSLHNDHEHSLESIKDELESTHSTCKAVKISQVDQTKVYTASLKVLSKQSTYKNSCTDDPPSSSSSESTTGEHTHTEIPGSASQNDDVFALPASCESHGKLLLSTEEHGAERRLPKILSPAISDEERENFVEDECETSLSENAAIPTPFPNLLKTSRLSSVTDFLDAKADVTEVDTVVQYCPKQEVFSFHNYSKESFGSSPDFLDADEHSQEDLEEDEYEDDCDDIKLASDWSLTLPASPPLVDEQSEERVESVKKSNTCVNDVASANENESFEQVSDCDIEVDECIATVDDLPSPVMLQTDTEKKKEEDFISSVVEDGPTTWSNAAVLGKILDEHADAIITQQLEKERTVSSAVLQDASRSTKTTLRILQIPDGKKQMNLQTMKTAYAVPVQLTSGQGFKLISKSSASKLNVSFVKPGIELPSSGSGLSLTLNGGRIGLATQSLSGEVKGHSSLLQTVSTCGSRYFVSASALKGPLLLSGAVKSPSEQSVNGQPTCYLVQRPLPASTSSESTGSISRTVMTTRPILAVPVKSADKAVSLQTGRQAYLVRYISPAKSGILVNGSKEKGENQCSQAIEGGKSRVFLKIVRSPNGTRVLSTTPYTSAKKPLYVAARSLQSPYLFMSSELSAGLKSSNSAHNHTHKLIPAELKNNLPQLDIHGQNQVDDGLVLQKSPFLPRHAHPRSQRKRSRRTLLEDSFETSSKIKRISSKALPPRVVAQSRKPVAKDVERILRLSPFSPFQQIKCPRQNQPVVVLNHPDADIPEVTNIMKSVSRYKDEVIKVALSENTIKALSELSFKGPDGILSNSYCISAGSRVKPSGNTVRERFILRLKLKKTRRNKYEVVRLPSRTGSEHIPSFTCWFCGRMFDNQEEWIGHGQRHLMEATRDWNKLL